MVSFESLYGIYGVLLFLSVKPLITFPNVKRDLLIFPVYLIISPCEFDYFNLSLPAKSTKLILPYFFADRVPCVCISLII
jgi:hypothetical protein